MPNHITNKVQAPKEVLATLLNAEGRIDFNTIIPFTGTFNWNGIDGRAETCAEAISAAPLNDHPLIASMQRDSRSKASIAGCDDEQFEQFVQMLRNKRATGYFHTLDFAIDKWGTKWNAYDQLVELDEGIFQFDTAWSCPKPVFLALSALHPQSEITVQFADEDLGSNCGTLVFKAGEIFSADVAGNGNEISTEDQEKWTAFARELTGRTADEDDE
jgi:hypothetical protein